MLTRGTEGDAGLSSQKQKVQVHFRDIPNVSSEKCCRTQSLVLPTPLRPSICPATCYRKLGFFFFFCGVKDYS